MLHLVVREILPNQPAHFPPARVLAILDEDGSWLSYTELCINPADMTPYLFELELDAVNASLAPFELRMEILSDDELEPCDSMSHFVNSGKVHRLCRAYPIYHPAVEGVGGTNPF